MLTRPAQCVYRALLKRRPCLIISVKPSHTVSYSTKPEPKRRTSLISKYLALSKARLGSLVALTAAAGYLIAPDPIFPLQFAATCIGTTFAIASANSINQYLEVDSDIKMRRTANRPLPTGELSLNHALAFGVVTGVVGCGTLALLVNPLSAALALGNILLYTLVYTPLKRVHWTNTWVGALVGAIPPLIGWAGNTGGLEVGAWILGYALFVWQIPHFLALSWPLKEDYERAGYKMLVSAHPQRVIDETYRYSAYLLPIGPMAVYAGLTTPIFGLSCTLLNVWMMYKSHGFKKTRGSVEARKAFMATLLYLPLLMLLFLIHKEAGFVFAWSLVDSGIDSGIAPIAGGEAITDINDTTSDIAEEEKTNDDNDSNKQKED